jgi:hypothetical protein
MPAAPAVLAALLALTVGAPANASNIFSQPKAYRVDVAQETVNGALTDNLTATFTNEGHVRVQTAELIWQAPLQVQSASLPAGMTQPTVATCLFGNATVPCVQLSNLNIAPGVSVTVKMGISPTCSPVTGTWTVVARPDAAFAFLNAGFDSNPLPLDPASSLTATFVDSCTLNFLAEPQSIVVNAPITSVQYDPTGGPVTVEVLDQTNMLVTTSSAPVTLALANNPGSATLSGTTTESAAGGVASFEGLSLDKQGNGYVLMASSPGMGSGTSGPFDAQGLRSPCSGGPCILTFLQGSSQVTATGSSGTSGTLVGSLNAPGDAALTCGSYQSADPNTYQFFSTDGTLNKVVTLDITHPLGSLPPYDAHDTNGFTIPGGDGDHDYDDVLVGQQICFQARYQFTVRAGTTLTSSTVDGATVYTGLLPDCPAQVTGPCHNRSADTAPRDPASPTGYDIMLVANIPAASGDPRMN